MPETRRSVKIAGDREILYAPDYVINAGGALYGIGLAALG